MSMKEIENFIEFNKNYNTKNIFFSKNFNFVVNNFNKILFIGKIRPNFETFLTKNNLNKIFYFDNLYKNKSKIKIIEFDAIIIINISEIQDKIKLLNYIFKNSSNDVRILQINFQNKNYNKKIFNKFDLIRKETISISKINFLKLRFINNFINNSILRIFNFNKVLVYKKNNTQLLLNKNFKLSIIVPCKNEEGNIDKIYNNFKNFDINLEILFGDDKSTDSTKEKILKLKSLKNFEIKFYNSPGIGKSQNVYNGLNKASGDILCIYDADRTVSIKDLKLSIYSLLNTNSDFINCSRMIYKQEEKAMGFNNYLGNIFFAKIFSFILNQKITDTLCGTKIFYKRHWNQIKKTNSSWGVRDLWGDFDLLLGAYTSNLKITEIPIKYYARKEGITKMTNLAKNGFIMLVITINSILKIKIL